MNKKHIIILLLILGFALVFIPLALTYVATINANIIGGAGWPTFKFIFFRSFNGLYPLLTFLGMLSIIAAILIGALKRNP